MKSNNNRNTLLLLGLLCLVLAVSYPFLAKKQDDAAVVEERLSAVKDAVSLLDKVQGISLDFGILKSPELTYLKDISTPLLNLPVGRANPFTPAK